MTKETQELLNLFIAIKELSDHNRYGLDAAKKIEEVASSGILFVKTFDKSKQK
jgi:hypothetical protein